MLSNENTVGVWAGKGKTGASNSFSDWKFWDDTGIDQCSAFSKECSSGEGNFLLNSNDKILIRLQLAYYTSVSNVYSVFSSRFL